MSWKRQLFLIHRWAGIVLCLCFALWFVSGIFMMYVRFPELTKPGGIRGAALERAHHRDKWPARVRTRNSL